MSSIDDALSKYACGPGGHHFNPGIRVGRAEAIPPGQPIPPATMAVCDRCAKANDPSACLFCDNSIAATAVLDGPEGRRVKGGICASCHNDLLDGPRSGWRRSGSGTA